MMSILENDELVRQFPGYFRLNPFKIGTDLKMTAR